jgi:chemotaxis protein MotB
MSGGGGGGGGAFEEEPEAHENHERYLLTYADMITLLMALFIILYALGQTDAGKYKQFQSGLQKTFGAPALDGGTGILDTGVMPLDPNQAVSLTDISPGMVQASKNSGSGSNLPPGSTGPVTSGNVEDAAAALRSLLASSGLPPGEAKVQVDDRGLVIVLATDGVSFSSGSWELRPEGRKVLDALAVPLNRFTNRMLVEGHTDDRPMAAPMSNWELSGNRASSVVRYLEEKHGVDPHRLTIGGYADTRPVATNTTTEGRSQNRRVEIVVVVRSPDVPAEPATSPSTTAARKGVITDPAKPAAVDPAEVTRPGESVPKVTTTTKATTHSTGH